MLHFVGETPTKAFSSSSAYSRLREALLRDALSRCVDNDVDTFQLVVDNIGTYVELAYYSHYSTDLLQCEHSVRPCFSLRLTLLYSRWAFHYCHSTKDCRLVGRHIRRELPVNTGIYFDTVQQGPKQGTHSTPRIRLTAKDAIQTGILDPCG